MSSSHQPSWERLTLCTGINYTQISSLFTGHKVVIVYTVSIVYKMMLLWCLPSRCLCHLHLNLYHKIHADTDRKGGHPSSGRICTIQCSIKSSILIIYKVKVKITGKENIFAVLSKCRNICISVPQWPLQYQLTAPAGHLY